MSDGEDKIDYDNDSESILSYSSLSQCNKA